jgi:hypothetical protein
VTCGQLLVLNVKPKSPAPQRMLCRSPVNSGRVLRFTTRDCEDNWLTGHRPYKAGSWQGLRTWVLVPEADHRTEFPRRRKPENIFIPRPRPLSCLMSAVLHACWAMSSESRKGLSTMRGRRSTQQSHFVEAANNVDITYSRSQGTCRALKWLAIQKLCFLRW